MQRAAGLLSGVGDHEAAVDPATEEGAQRHLAHEVLGSTGRPELQAACLRLLASVGRAAHLPVVRERLASEHLAVRLAAIRALGRFGEEQDIRPLEATAREDRSPWAAIAAARALRESGGDEILAALAGSQHPRAALGLQALSETRSW